MAKVALAEPLVLENATLKIDVDNYEAAVAEVAIVPTTPRSSVSFKGIDGGTYNKPTQGASEWVCNLTYAQDWAEPTSLSNYLLEHEGETVPAVFVPEAGSGLPSFPVDLTVAPGQIGGPVDQVLTASVSLGCTKPVKGATV